MPGLRVAELQNRLSTSQPPTTAAHADKTTEPARGKQQDAPSETKRQASRESEGEDWTGKTQKRTSPQLVHGVNRGKDIGRDKRRACRDSRRPQLGDKHTARKKQKKRREASRL